MKFNLMFNLDNDELPIDYQKCVLHFLKKSIGEYDEGLYEQLYHEKDPTVKYYTFSIYLNNPGFKVDKIIVEDKKVILNFQILFEYAIDFRNAFFKQINSKVILKNNVMTLCNVNVSMLEKIEDEKILIKMMSPLLIRYKDDDKVRFVTFEDDDFEEKLILVINNAVTRLRLDVKTEDFKIRPINNKTTIIKNFNSTSKVSLGIFEISANVELLNILYAIGIGSKRSSGFGMFKILK